MSEAIEKGNINDIVESVLMFMIEHPIKKHTIEVMSVYLGYQIKSIEGALMVLEGEGILVKTVKRDHFRRVKEIVYDVNMENEYANTLVNEIMSQGEA